MLLQPRKTTKTNLQQKPTKQKRILHPRNFKVVPPIRPRDIPPFSNKCIEFMRVLTLKNNKISTRPNDQQNARQKKQKEKVEF